MSADQIEYEWFSIDEGWDTSPVRPRDAAEVFAATGATGLASWRPSLGVEVVIAMRDGLAIDTDLSAADLAAVVALETGAAVYWGSPGSIRDSGFVEGAIRRTEAPRTAERSVFVFPHALDARDAGQLLLQAPGDSDGEADPAVHHIVVGGRSVFVTESSGRLDVWPRALRPVIGVTASPCGLSLSIWAISGYLDGPKHRRHSASPDVMRDWWQVWNFGAAHGGAVDFARAWEWYGGEQRILSTLERVLPELGLDGNDAVRLHDLAAEPWSPTTAAEIAETLSLPTEVVTMLHDGAPPDAVRLPERRPTQSLGRERTKGQ